MSTVAAVKLWGTQIGAVSIDDGSRVATFQYEPSFTRSGIEVAPLTMPLQAAPYAFPSLNEETFRGLPGLLAESLPDRYGNALIDAWLASEGRAPGSFNVVERLCYIGTRGMGALEFAPAQGPQPAKNRNIRLDTLVAFASEVLTNRERLVASLAEGHQEQAMRDILSVGTSAGGARAKAVIAYNATTHVVRSGQIDAGPGFEHWLLKFDGVSGNGDRGLQDPLGYGAIEYAYYKMARAAGIEMAESRLLEEDGRRHFMTRRFDREGNAKLHMQSLGSLAHFDFNSAGAYSYEQALRVLNQLGLSKRSVEEQFRRMAFNVIARNQDDHVKNVGFLMDRDGVWKLAPAFDITYAYRPSSPWTNQHQMTINQKRDDFTLEDLRQCADTVSMKRGRADRIVEEVATAVAQWPAIASSVQIPDDQIEKIAQAHRLHLAA